MYYLTEYIRFPYEHIILQLPRELELIVFAYSHNVRIGKNSITYILNV